MVEMVLEAEQDLDVPPMKKFRGFVDALKCSKRDRIFIELLYLTGSRCSELLTKTTPYELKEGKSKPYGKLLQWELQNYTKSDGTKIKLLLLKLGVAKRSKKKDTEENKIVVKTRVIPIPLDPKIEPWCIGILKWLAEKKKLNFDFCRMTAQNVVKKHLQALDPEVYPHKLRHWRCTHLVRAYSFTPLQLCSFVGWSLKSMSSQMGINISSNVDVYLHLAWRDYIDKLLIPIQEVIYLP